MGRETDDVGVRGNNPRSKVSEKDRGDSSQDAKKRKGGRGRGNTGRQRT